MIEPEVSKDFLHWAPGDHLSVPSLENDVEGFDHAFADFEIFGDLLSGDYSRDLEPRDH